jgi:hypothetical protein
MKTRDSLRLILDEGWYQVAQVEATGSSSILQSQAKSRLRDILRN